MFARNKSMSRFLIGSVIGGACVVTSVTMAFAEPASPPPSTEGASAPAARAGQRIYVDPKTGARTAAPEGAAAAPDPSLSTSHEGLVEEAAPGGGATINLQGRFRSAAEATVAPDGKVSVGCREPGVPAEKE